jgi:predicted lipid carrier protein YhbT
MSHETALHRVDAQSAHSCVEPIAEPLARDAVDGALDWFLPDARAGSLYPGKGESYLLRQTDGDGVWLVRFPANEAVVSRQSGPADLELAGIASDILLFLWRRAPADRLQLGGNPSLAERFHDLAPSI